jgi:YHS domain-containing protein
MADTVGTSDVDGTLCRDPGQRCRVWLVAIVAFLPSVPSHGKDVSPPSSREALQALNGLIGSWRGTGIPAGTREEQEKGFWTETISWQWQFKGKESWFKAEFNKSKYFVSGELRWLPNQQLYQLTLVTKNKHKQIFQGNLTRKVLSLERAVMGGKERLVFTLLHADRHLYRLDVQPAGKSFFTKRYHVGATREGGSFAQGDGKPECIVSGGLGTIAVNYNGQTYYVCCSGCRTEFNENPEKYIKEFQQKQNKKKNDSK